MDREIMRDPEREVGYGITDSYDEIVETLQGAPVSTDTKLGRYMTEFETRVRKDTDEIYMRDRHAHAYTRHLMETETRMSREAWVRSTHTSDLVRGVTYKDISSPFEELSHIGSPRADDHEHLMLPEMLEDPYVEVALQEPPSPDYIPGPEEPEHAPPLPDYVPGPEHADDEIVAEDQPYAEDASPIAQLPEYVPESDFEAHLEDDDDKDPEEDPIDYLADGGDNDDDEEESSKDHEDDEDDDMDVKADEEEEEDEHPAPADSIVVAPTAADHAPSVEETKPFETDESAATPPPHPAYRMTARISIPAPVPMPAWTDSEVVRLLAIPSPPASPLSPWDRRAHAYTRHLMKTEVMMSREAWVRATDASDLVYGEVMSLCTTVLGQMSEIRELQAADRRRQTVISELLGIDHRRSIEISELRTALQGQVTALQAQVPHYRDSRDLLEVLHSQSYQRRLVTVHRLDIFMASHFILYQPTKFYEFYLG
nr:hypothetical protein [Tanacetum cinerariifolium]